MKAKFKLELDGSVTLDYDDFQGQRVSKNFFVSSAENASYIKFYDKNGNLKQICKGLQITGSTLTSSKESLLKTIRREYRIFKKNNQLNNWSL